MHFKSITKKFPRIFGWLSKFERSTFRSIRSIYEIEKSERKNFDGHKTVIFSKNLFDFWDLNKRARLKDFNYFLP